MHEQDGWVESLVAEEMRIRGKEQDSRQLYADFLETVRASGRFTWKVETIGTDIHDKPGADVYLGVFPSPPNPELEVVLEEITDRFDSFALSGRGVRANLHLIEDGQGKFSEVRDILASDPRVSEIWSEEFSK
ncbi:hypothetical protein HYW42_04840 [Candidatus Daviesbacteria bacterium]|nr:hypothetical protein [Candidatus Daviesbacteria bacterium]